MTRLRLTLAAALGAAVIGGGAYLLARREPPPAPPAPAPVVTEDPQHVSVERVNALRGLLEDILASQQRIIVLFADEAALKSEERAAANATGQAIFHDKLARIAKAEAAFHELLSKGGAARHATLGAVLDYVESDASLFDADRLAFREVLRGLLAELSHDSSLPAVKLHKRVAEDLDALAEIERNYDKEISQIFSRFDTRAIQLKRERWADYLAHLAKRYNREAVLKEYGVVLPYPERKEPEPTEAEIFGNGLPPKTVVLTFDDGPHRAYTEEITAILKQYGAPAVFFQVGNNLGSVDGTGQAKLGANAVIDKRLLEGGFAIANHSLTHAQLSKQSGDALKNEILGTDTLLRAVSEQRSPLFRFPYGARNAEGLGVLEQAKLKSVMWNIDSLDWADPVPNSIADRVLRSVDANGRGIILFHDIHERTVKALPLVLDRLVAEGYQFAGWNGTSFVTRDGEAKTGPAPTITTGYADSWALVVGIDEYTKWPRLNYAVRDAQAMRQTLIDKFGFSPQRVVMLTNAEATRTNILGAFHDRLSHDLKKNDRVFVFYAGHGATRKLTSGRDLGYIVPVDADPEKLGTDAIAMTELQNISETLAAKHVLFVMDACYSGLGLTRGAGGKGFLRENAKRVGRQMLTAGGTDQLVADGGPNGHSVFTWTVLQGLGGKADLNNDGLITATELAAYVAPTVAGVSSQTPAFGSLPGSEGGDFVFEIAPETEFLTAETKQLSGEAISLNTRMEAAQPAPKPAKGSETAAAPAPVTVKDLQGKDTQLTPPAPAFKASNRQLAQRANDRGLQLYREKRYAEAEAEFTEALKLRPDFALAANNLGFVFYKQDKFQEAARWFQNAIKADPSRTVAYLNLGDALARSGDVAGARKAYGTYLELAPVGAAVPYVREQLGKLPPA